VEQKNSLSISPIFAIAVNSILQNSLQSFQLKGGNGAGIYRCLPANQWEAVYENSPFLNTLLHSCYTASKSTGNEMQISPEFELILFQMANAISFPYGTPKYFVNLSKFSWYL